MQDLDPTDVTTLLAATKKQGPRIKRKTRTPWTAPEEQLLLALIRIRTGWGPSAFAWGEWEQRFEENERSASALKRHWEHTLRPREGLDVHLPAWSEDELARLCELASLPRVGKRDWVALAEHFPGRTPTAVSGKWDEIAPPRRARVVPPGAAASGPKMVWTPEEDARLLELAKTRTGGAGWWEICREFEGRTQSSVKQRHSNLIRTRNAALVPRPPPIFAAGGDVAEAPPPRAVQAQVVVDLHPNPLAEQYFNREQIPAFVHHPPPTYTRQDLPPAQMHPPSTDTLEDDIAVASSSYSAALETQYRHHPRSFHSYSSLSPYPSHHPGPTPLSSFAHHRLAPEASPSFAPHDFTPRPFSHAPHPTAYQHIAPPHQNGHPPTAFSHPPTAFSHSAPPAPSLPAASSPYFGPPIFPSVLAPSSFMFEPKPWASIGMARRAPLSPVKGVGNRRAGGK